MSRAVTDLEVPCKDRCLMLLDRVKQELGIELIITHTLRTPEEQGALYAKGRTAPGSIVTNAKPGYSYHNFGLAFDFAILRNGKPIWTASEAVWERIGEIGESLGLTWGGRFKTLKDRCHFEWRGNGTLAVLRKTLRPADPVKWS